MTCYSHSNFSHGLFTSTFSPNTCFGSSIRKPFNWLLFFCGTRTSQVQIKLSSLQRRASPDSWNIRCASFQPSPVSPVVSAAYNLKIPGEIKKRWFSTTCTLPFRVLALAEGLVWFFSHCRKLLLSPSLWSSAISGSGWVDALSSGTGSASLTGVTSPAKQAGRCSLGFQIALSP